MEFTIENNRLRNDAHPVHQMYCPKNKQLLSSAEYVVVHYTAGGNALSSAFYLTANDTNVSAHVLIGRDGRVIQMVGFDRQAWHAGSSSYDGHTNLNSRSIGIELQNAGRLHKRDGAYYSWFNKRIPPEEVYVQHRESKELYWHNYNMTQLEVLDAVVRVLMTNFPIKAIVRHSTISQRKMDPGPALEEKWFALWNEALREASPDE